MRTTLTLDDDLAVILKRRADETGRPFKEVVNEAIRAGLVGHPTEAEVEIRQPRDMGPFLVDPVTAMDVLDQLDDEETARSMRGGRSGEVR